MRKKYYDVYRDLYDIYRVSHSESAFFRPFRRLLGGPLSLSSDIRDLRMIDDAITRAQAELGLLDTLRPDARFFLLVNVHQMIVLPLTHREGDSGGQIAIENYVRDDVRAILEASREEANDNEISGHMIVDALSRVWRKLRTTELEVWG